MKVIGLCKAFSGHEFLEASIDSIYKNLEAIYFVVSDTNWAGEKLTGNHKVLETVLKYQKNKDIDKKIHIISTSSTNQDEQYKIGHKKIIEDYPDIEWLCLFDTDEVWEEVVFENAVKRLDFLDEYNSVCCQMYTYIKSPLYRVDPLENCKPFVFVRALFFGYTAGIRGSKACPTYYMEDIFFHHFTYVRETEEDVFKKIKTSLIGDKDCEVICDPVDIDKWKKDKWDHLPYSKDFHTTKGYETSWHKIEQININQLPRSVRGLEIVKEAI